MTKEATHNGVKIMISLKCSQGIRVGMVIFNPSLCNFQGGELTHCCAPLSGFIKHPMFKKVKGPVFVAPEDFSLFEGQLKEQGRLAT